jgi:hypothetical protein
MKNKCKITVEPYKRHESEARRKRENENISKKDTNKLFQVDIRAYDAENF